MLQPFLFVSIPYVYENPCYIVILLHAFNYHMCFIKNQQQHKNFNPIAKRQLASCVSVRFFFYISRSFFPRLFASSGSVLCFAFTWCNIIVCKSYHTIFNRYYLWFDLSPDWIHLHAYMHTFKVLAAVAASLSMA